MKKILRPYPFVYFLSLFFGLMLLFFILVSYLNFSNRNIFFGFLLFFFSFTFLSICLSWVQKIERIDDKESREQKIKDRFNFKR